VPFERGVLAYNTGMPVKNIIPGQNIDPDKIQRAHELRRKMTPAENALWQELRTNKLGLHFRRQQVIEGFIVDFYCHSAGLIIELDGDIHQEQKEYDDSRDKILENMGLHVLRYSNDDVLFRLPSVLVQLNEILGKK
jgi:very-short-patch-repair endonuclease